MNLETPPIPTQPKRGQGFVEFTLVLPLILVFLFGIIEVSRLMIIISGSSSGSRQAVRYGAVSGTDTGTGTGQPFYLDCKGMRQIARGAAIFSGIGDTNIDIQYDHGFITDVIGFCNYSNVPVRGAITSSVVMTRGSVVVGDRVVMTITAPYAPLVKLIPIPEFNVRFVAARTVFNSIVGATQVLSGANLGVIVTKSATSVLVNTPLTYTFSTSNTGNLVGYTITLRIQTNLSPIVSDVVGSGWTFSRTSTVNSPPTYIFYRNSFSITTDSPITITGSSSTAQTIYITTTILSSYTYDPFMGNNKVSVSTTVTTVGVPDLTINKIASLSSITTSNPLTYTIIVSNVGTGNAKPVSITDTLPAGARLISSSGVISSWQCSTGTIVGDQQPVMCTLGTFASPITLNVSPLSGSIASVMLVVSAPPTAGTINNSANVWTTMSGDNTSNNTSGSIATTVVNTPTVDPCASGGSATPSSTYTSISPTVSPNPAAAGSTVTLGFRVLNECNLPISVTKQVYFYVLTTTAALTFAGGTVNQSALLTVDANGYVTTTATTRGFAGTSWISATVVGHSPYYGPNQLAIDCTSTATSITQTTAPTMSPNPITAGASGVLTFTIKNYCGSGILGKVVNLTVGPSAAGVMTFTATTTPSNFNGEVIFSVATNPNATSVTYTVTPTISGDGTFYGSRAIQLNGCVPTGYPSSSYSSALSPVSASAGVTTTYAATLRDNCSIAITNTTFTVSVVSASGSVYTSTTATTNGSVLFSYTTRITVSGTYVISITRAGQSTPVLYTISILVGPIASISVVSPTTLYAGQSSNFTATATDAYGNISSTISLAWTATGGTATGVPGTTNASYASSIITMGIGSSIASGSYAITATSGITTGIAAITVSCPFIVGNFTYGSRVAYLAISNTTNAYSLTVTSIVITGSGNSADNVRTINATDINGSGGNTFSIFASATDVDFTISKTLSYPSTSNFNLQPINFTSSSQPWRLEFNANTGSVLTVDRAIISFAFYNSPTSAGAQTCTVIR